MCKLAVHWGAPIIYIINADVKKPPAARFLYEWSQAAWSNGSVDQTFMVMNNVFTKALGGLVARMFCAGGMPMQSLSRKELDAWLDAADTASPRADWSIPALSTALVTRRGFGEGAYSQLLMRLLRRASGRKKRA